MLDFSKLLPVPSKADFLYWFLRKGTTAVFAVINTASDIAIADYDVDKDIITLYDNDMSAEDTEAVYTDIRKDFEMYTKRPEFVIGTSIPEELLSDAPIDKERMGKLKSYCEQFIKGCCYMMYEDEAAKKYSDRAIKWLTTTDFYTAPASTQYHDSDPSGLLRHTMKVVNRTIELTSLVPFSSVNIAEAIIVAITHDWCKINFYESFMRNVKNEATGAWEQVPSYRHKKSDYPFGHGVTSLYMAEKLFKLTLEQALAIRWHMDIYDVSDYEKSDLFDAKEAYPMVRLVQMADQLSII